MRMLQDKPCRIKRSGAFYTTLRSIAAKRNSARSAVARRSPHLYSGQVQSCLRYWRRPYGTDSRQQPYMADSLEAEHKMQQSKTLHTQILPISPTKIGRFTVHDSSDLPLEDWHLELDETSPDAERIRTAASRLKNSDIPVAFPTETVYGLGADATRSAAVRGIYAAKQRPSDNPLIVHIASISQLRRLILPSTPQLSSSASSLGRSSDLSDASKDPIPEIYKPLIRRFWPGPLTIILPVANDSPLATEVTAGLRTFGARMPRNLLALSLIKLADRPIAAPSANASTKPSPTAAEHVLYDLDGRIELIVDGGPCDVGVESTVVDGLSSPPLILRPGGVSLGQLRQCSGWEDTDIGYEDQSRKDGSKPRAPGMKYRHYSPKAQVVLFESGVATPSLPDIMTYVGERRRIGIVRTKRWQKIGREDPAASMQVQANGHTEGAMTDAHPVSPSVSHVMSKLPATSPIHAMLEESFSRSRVVAERHIISPSDGDGTADIEVWDVQLGPTVRDVARGLFATLRDLDRENVDCIMVEGVDDIEGDVAAAVMNRLRKAAEVRIE